MGLTWLGASSVLLLLVVTVFVALPRMTRRKTHFVAIEAQKTADDIVAPEVALSDELPRHDYKGKPEPAIFKPRRERVLLLCGAISCLLISFASALLTLLTDISWAVPGIALLGSCACLVTLRLLAMKDAKQRGKNYRRAASASSYSTVVLRKAHSRDSLAEATTKDEYDGVLTDQKSQPIELSVPAATRPIKHQAQKPVNYAAKSLRYARTHREPSRISLEGTAGREELTVRENPHRALRPSQTSWDVTDLPQPTYLDVEEAPRPRPEPLELPQYTKSRSRTLAEADDIGKKSSEFKLDEILKRRRA